MRLITRQDDELIRTVNVAAQTQGRQVVAAHLRDKYKARPFDPEAGFAYGVCCYGLMAIVQSDMEKHEHFLDMIESLSATLEHNPQHWLARYYRALAGDLVPPGYGKIAGYLFPVNYSLEDTVEDRYHLIRQQAEVESQPYFFCPYVSLADYYVFSGEVDRAWALWEQAVQAVPQRPIPYLAEVLFKPFRELVYHLRETRMNEQAEQVRGVAQVLFPRQRDVATI